MVEEAGDQGGEAFRPPLLEHLAAADADGNELHAGVSQPGPRFDARRRRHDDVRLAGRQRDAGGLDIAGRPGVLVQLRHLARQEGALVEEPALQAEAVAAPIRNAGQHRGGGDGVAVVQQDDGAEVTVAQFARQPEEAADAVMRAAAPFRVQIDPENLLHRGIVAEQLIRQRARLGDQGDRRAREGGNGVDVRQVPDHVADAGQRLHNGHRLQQRRCGGRFRGGDHVQDFLHHVPVRYRQSAPNVNRRCCRTGISRCSGPADRLRRAIRRDCEVGCDAGFPRRGRIACV